MSVIPKRTVVALLVLLTFSPLVGVADREGELSVAPPDRVGIIVLFSERGGDPSHPLFESEFWALTGPTG